MRGLDFADVVENFVVEAAGGVYAKFACSFSGAVR
jgi:hypothetical protein